MFPWRAHTCITCPSGARSAEGVVIAVIPISGDQVRVTTCPSGMVSVERRTSCAWLRAA